MGTGFTTTQRDSHCLETTDRCRTVCRASRSDLRGVAAATSCARSTKRATTTRDVPQVLGTRAPTRHAPQTTSGAVCATRDARQRATALRSGPLWCPPHVMTTRCSLATGGHRKADGSAKCTLGLRGRTGWENTLHKRPTRRGRTTPYARTVSHRDAHRHVPPKAPDQSRLQPAKYEGGTCLARKRGSQTTRV